MVDFSRAEAAKRAGVSVERLDEQLALGILAPRENDRFTNADVRRMSLVSSLQDAGIPLDGLSAALRQGQVTFDFFDDPAYDEHFSPLSDRTFQQVSDQTGIPMQLLVAMREASGSPPPEPEDRVREAERAIVPWIEMQVRSGRFRAVAIERVIRVMGDSLGRYAEQEDQTWQSEVVEPMLESGAGPEDIGTLDISKQLGPLEDRALVAMLHLHQRRTWTGSIVVGFEMLLAQAGIYSRLERPPAMCFLDIAGYTRLTAERGDKAAADLAEALSRLVRRASVQHGGRPVKWLGDGVMFYFPDPGKGVVAALDMAEGVAGAGLPPAHVGLHAGPVVFQEGDYFGQTVNLASRIAEFARPGEVLVSQAVVEAAADAPVGFVDIGNVELKGVAGAVHLQAAHRA